MTEQAVILKVHGVGRVLENKNCLYVAFNREPTDDELREVHGYLIEFAPSMRVYKYE